MPAEDEQPQGLHDRLADRFGVGGRAAYGSAGCAVAVALCGLAAYLFKQPMLFPSLGPSALLFFEQPTAPESSPYNALVALTLPPLGASHPQAGATTLLVSLGLLDQPRQLAWILAGVLLLTTVALVLNRLAGLPVTFRHH
jgi:CBS domain-containing membrane protein